MVATAPEHFNHLKCPFETFLVFCGMKRTARVLSFKPPSSSGHVPYVTSFHSHFPFPSTPSPVTSHYNTSPHSTRPSRFLPFHLLSPVTPIHHLIPLALVSFHSVSCHQSLQYVTSFHSQCSFPSTLSPVTSHSNVTSFHSHFPFPSTPSPVNSHSNTSSPSTCTSHFLPLCLLSPVTPIRQLLPLALLVSFQSISCHQSLQYVTSFHYVSCHQSLQHLTPAVTHLSSCLLLSFRQFLPISNNFFFFHLSCQTCLKLAIPIAITSIERME